MIRGANTLSRGRRRRRCALRRGSRLRPGPRAASAHGHVALGARLLQPQRERPEPGQRPRSRVGLSQRRRRLRLHEHAVAEREQPRPPADLERGRRRSASRAGVRLLFFTLGARARDLQLSGFNLWELDGEAAFHIRIWRIDPYFGVRGGYAFVGSLGSGAVVGRLGRLGLRRERPRDQRGADVRDRRLRLEPRVDRRRRERRVPLPQAPARSAAPGGHPGRRRDAPRPAASSSTTSRARASASAPCSRRTSASTSRRTAPCSRLCAGCSRRRCRSSASWSSFAGPIRGASRAGSSA